jgi:hypothetical protein
MKPMQSWASRTKHSWVLCDIASTTHPEALAKNNETQKLWLIYGFIIYSHKRDLFSSENIIESINT